ncbi:EcsC family protein [Desulfocurvibacter africanus]|uniref:EcsC protein n=2 Tax=Desulfocurvibacter africanus TaxID=873 RepID=F3YYE3_DESAF|nr:EcsC family protein [Desulfocurvibacter africanus]EGJ49587.1 hypothetical protein Desaf_1248 [Desulfocurvibacter africanus subsp. africanus str. Walvis Bay]
MTEKDREELRQARELLESPGLAARLSNLAGAPVEAALRKLPVGVRDGVDKATRKALVGALNTALKTLDRDGTAERTSRNKLHKTWAAAAGGVGGLFGFSGLLLELPVTTTIMLRSIADIAHSNGEDLRQPDARLACLEVFALGGPSAGDDAAETGYFAVRASLAKAVAEAAKYAAGASAAEKGAPVLVRLLSAITKRFGVTVSQKFAAQAVPVVGALGGAVVNSIFMSHFQNVASGHFTVRRLERAYGKDTVRTAWEALGGREQAR